MLVEDIIRGIRDFVLNKCGKRCQIFYLLALNGPFLLSKFVLQYILATIKHIVFAIMHLIHWNRTARSTSTTVAAGCVIRAQPWRSTVTIVTRWWAKWNAVVIDKLILTLTTKWQVFTMMCDLQITVVPTPSYRVSSKTLRLRQRKGTMAFCSTIPEACVPFVKQGFILLHIKQWLSEIIGSLRKRHRLIPCQLCQLCHTHPPILHNIYSVTKWWHFY